MHQAFGFAASRKVLPIMTIISGYISPNLLLRVIKNRFRKKAAKATSLRILQSILQETSLDKSANNLAVFWVAFHTPLFRLETTILPER